MVIACAVSLAVSLAALTGRSADAGPSVHHSVVGRGEQFYQHVHLLPKFVWWVKFLGERGRKGEWGSESSLVHLLGDAVVSRAATYTSGKPHTPLFSYSDSPEA